MRNLALVLIVFMLGWTGTAFATTYAYDAAGRLVAEIAADGSSAVYSYDATGNITGIQKFLASNLAIFGFDPAQGLSGQQVIIQGSGFSTTPSSNTVKFNGVAAAVAASSANQITTTVPSTATTGPISLTVGSTTVTSSQIYTIQKAPTIASFVPTLVDLGSPVTLTGANLSPVTGGTRIQVSATLAPTSSVTATQAIFTPQLGASGPVIVTTPYGQAVSTTDLIVMPSGITAATVIASNTLVVGGSSHSLNINQQNKLGALAFNASAGQWLSVQLSATSTSPSGWPIGYQVYSPANVLISSGSVGTQTSSSDMSIHLPQIPVTGTYLVVLGTVGLNTTEQITATLEANATLASNGTSLAVATTAAGQNKRVIFTGTVGQSLGLALTNVTNQLIVWVYNPDGTPVNEVNCLSTDPGCQLSLNGLTQTGPYSIFIFPAGQVTMSSQMTLTQDKTGALTPNTPLNVSIPTRGQNALLNFTATDGEDLTLNVGSIVTNPVNTVGLGVTVIDPMGNSTLTYSGEPSWSTSLSGLIAGQYSVLIAPYYGATATFQVSIQ